jgi:hypothetical protein
MVKGGARFFPDFFIQVSIPFEKRLVHFTFRPLGDFVCKRGCDCGYGGHRQGFKNSGHCVSPVD